MFGKKVGYIILLVTVLALLIPAAAFANGGPDNLPPGDPSSVSPVDADGLWEPQTPEEVELLNSIQAPDQAVIDAATKEKLQFLPITAEQDAQWEKAFEQQMMLLQKQLSPEELATLDMDNLAQKIDVNVIQEETGFNMPKMMALTLEKDAVGMKDGVEARSGVSPNSQVNIWSARHGDFLLGHKGWAPWGYWRHAAMWDAYAGGNKTLHARGYGWGVRHDSSYWFRTHYSRAAVMGVYTSSGVRSSAGWYARWQLGEPYTLFTSKTNQSHWYCSKLVWASYYWRSGRRINLDPNGGFWVTPNNLWYSGWTYVRSIG